MKKETAKNQKKWILPVVIIAALLVIGGIVAAIFLGPWNQGEKPDDAPKGPYELYYNVDREENIDPETNISSRKADAEGKYWFRFAVNGEYKEFAATDRKLANAIDFMDILALTFDENGLIIDALPPASVAQELAKDNYVRSFDGTNLVVNSSMAMNGMDVPITVTENTKIFNVDKETAKNVGELITELDEMDKVSVYANEQGEVTHIFMSRKAIASDIYYRVKKMMADGVTTRVPDENGVYTIQMAHKGQLVDLKCRDVNIVNIIDTGYYTSAIMGLRFDEEGYIIGQISPEEALRGKLLYRDYTVTAVDGETVSIESIWYNNSDIGNTATMQVTKDCELYLIEDQCEADFIGQATDTLKVGDRMYVYSDFEGNPIMIFINNRRMFSPMYYVIKRYAPDENGYYVYDVLVEGKQKQVKTKDEKLVAKIASAGTGCVGLELKGNVITAVAQNGCVCGQGSMAGRFVTEIMGSVGRFVQSHDSSSGTNAVLADDFVAYNLSNAYGVTYGSKTELRKGDYITGFTNDRNELIYAFVTQRYEEGTKNYWNSNRMYDFNTLETKRQPDADGYYVFDMVCEGKPVQVKTKDKDMASWIDRQSECFPALRVSKGIIKGAYGHMSATLYCRIQMSGGTYHHVDEARKLFYYRYKDGVKEIVDSGYFRVSKNAVAYNLSSGYDNYSGEKTKIKEGDVFRPYIDGDTQEVVMFAIVTRKLDIPLCWNVNRMYNSSTGETTREPDADGYYVYQMAVDGQIKTYKTKDKAVADNVDSFSAAVGLVVEGDIIKRAVLARHTNKATELTTGSGYDVQSVKGNKLTLAQYETRYESEPTYGKPVEVKLSKNCKIFDVSSYANPFGAKAKLEQGDRVALYYNEEQEVTYAFITSKMTREAGYLSYCEHCNKEVRWQPLSWDFWGTDPHYYLPADTYKGRMVVGYKAAKLEENPALKQMNVTLDLNGKVLSTSSQNFDVYGTLNVVDSVGTGKMLGGGTVSYGGNISVYEQGVLNIYSGTLTSPEGVEKIKRGGIIYLSSGTVNMYGGTITGGLAEDGGNVYVRTDGTFNLYGGEITNGTGDYGGNFYALGAAKINLYGGTVSDGFATDRGGNFRVQGQAATETEPDRYVTLNVGKDAVVSGGTAGRTGGSIHMSMGNATIDGIVEKGTAAKPDGTLADGGNLCLDGNTKVTINGKVRDSVNANVGGNIKMDAGVQLLITGSVTGGNATLGGNIHAAAGTRIVIDGGTVTGIKTPGSTNIYTAGADDKTTDLVLNNATTDGDITVGKQVNVILAGKVQVPKGTVDGMRLLNAGTLIDVSLLDAASAVTIEAEGVFTTEREDIDTIQAVFTPADPTVEIKKEGNALAYAVKVLTPVEKAEMLTTWAEENAQAFETGEDLPDKCPVCGAKGVNWVGLTNESHLSDVSFGIFGTAGNHHFYLAEEINLADKALLAEVGSGTTVCFFMNKNINTSGQIANRGTLNMFGPGTYTFAGGHNKTMFEVFNPTVEYNFYGGTYTNTSTGNSSVGASMAMFAMSYSRVINIYGGTFNTGNIALYRPWDCNGSTLNIHGGTINGGNATVIDLSFKNGAVNMYGGKITGGTASKGGNVNLNASTFNMFGGEIYGGTSSSHGGNIYVGTNATLNMSGDAHIYDGTLSGSGRGTDVMVEGGIMTMADNARVTGKANGIVVDIEYKTGNDNATLTMSGNASVTSKQGGYALRIYKTAIDKVIFADGWNGETYLYISETGYAAGDKMPACVELQGSITGNVKVAFISGDNVARFDVKFENGELILVDLPAQDAE